MRRLCLIAGAALSTALLPFAAGGVQADSANPVELGRVRWQRSLPEALPVAREEHKPVFVLFQEVPGCLTCQTYGQHVLSHPLIVEAIESLFVPVAVFNNRGGQDAATLNQFKEPSWNNPVVRIISADQKDLVPRLSGNYRRSGVVDRMITALEAHGSPVPAYLRLLAEELTARESGAEKSAFAMYCFWSGEGMFGKLDGVVSTRPGFLEGREVVEVEYDPAKLGLPDLISAADRHNMAAAVYTYNDQQLRVAANAVGRKAKPVPGAVRPDREPKYYMAQTPLRFVPMTGLQAARVNAAVGARADFTSYLSPRQLSLLDVIQRHPKAGWQNAVGSDDLVSAWTQAAATAQKLRAAHPPQDSQ